MILGTQCSVAKAIDLYINSLRFEVCFAGDIDDLIQCIKNGESNKVILINKLRSFVVNSNYKYYYGDSLKDSHGDNRFLAFLTSDFTCDIRISNDEKFRLKHAKDIIDFMLDNKDYLKGTITIK